MIIRKGLTIVNKIIEHGQYTFHFQNWIFILVKHYTVRDLYYTIHSFIDIKNQMHYKKLSTSNKDIFIFSKGKEQKRGFLFRAHRLAIIIIEHLFFL